MHFIIYLLGLWLMDPWEANELAARGDRQLQLSLDRTCWRESKCTRISTHAIDAWAGRRAYSAAVRRGLLDPDNCPFHRDRDAGWSTRGAHGLMAAYNLRFLPVSCLPAWTLDIPFASALAAGNKARWLCEQKGACTFPRIRSWWGTGRPPRSRKTVVDLDAGGNLSDHFAEMAGEGWTIDGLEQDGARVRLHWRPS